MQCDVDTININAVVGESARLEVGAAVNYIKSGEAEIAAAVDSKTAAFNLNANRKTNNFNLNASAKTTAFNNNAGTKTSDFNLNASTKTASFDSNASAKTTAFNNNAGTKTSDFNLNASAKTTAFNDNYVAKKALIDENVSVASGYAATAEQYAIGEPSEPTGGSAKYWANQATTTLSNKQDKLTAGSGIDITNNVISVTATGVEGFTANEVETIWESI